ncbi:flagellar hook-length control protein FliK [Enterovirga sp.]|uniref:flagellar hook-length control protein FliK n=1 Tax=Enterovirga sp. TaxID=2026350 RepID=UPI00261ADB5D|nr:flagellar hook-length control protein FliK [Enterovirga sp.]
MAPAGPGGAGPHPVLTGLPLAAVPVEIGLRSLEGLSRFEIRLAPVDLGGIDVRLDIAEDGQVSARLLVDRPETLAWLQRDASQLERALEQAGLRPQEGGISLTLRDSGADQNSGRNAQAEPGPDRRMPGDPGGDDGRGAPDKAAPARPLSWNRGSGLDLRI